MSDPAAMPKREYLEGSLMASPETLDQKSLDELEKKYDTALNMRAKGPVLSKVFYGATIVFALYHIWTAGFGTPVDYVHMGIHLSGLYFFIFVGFPLLRSASSLAYAPRPFLKPGNIPIV